MNLFMGKIAPSETSESLSSLSSPATSCHIDGEFIVALYTALLSARIVRTKTYYAEKYITSVSVDHINIDICVWKLYLRD
jgi:hypothetical protein